MTDWLLGQLPRVMQRNEVVAGFVRGCGEVTESVRARLDSLEHELDVDLAAPEILRYLAGWLGVHLDSLPAAAGQDARDAQRRLVRAVASTLGFRGTRYATEELLRALTGGRAEVVDPGGVYVTTAEVPAPSNVVEVVLDTFGGLSQSQIEAFLAEEVPVGTQVRVRLRG